MSNRKSSIEWLVEHFGGIENCTPDFRYIIEQAKEMHKQEIINAYMKGYGYDVVGYNAGEQCYNKTFGK